MAIIRGAYGGGQIKGSISGTTYQGGPYGQVARNRTVPVNPNSPGQVNIRAAMSILSNHWSNNLTVPERNSWGPYAAETPLPDRFGTSQNVSGRQMFMRTNVARFAAGLSILETAPTTPGIAPAPFLVLASVVGDGLTLEGAPASLAVGDMVRISVGDPVGVARNFYKSPFRDFVAVISTDTYPFVLRVTVAVGQKFFVQARLYQASGKVSNAIIFPSPVTTV